MTGWGAVLVLIVAVEIIGLAVMLVVIRRNAKRSGVMPEERRQHDGWETIATWVEYPDGRRSTQAADIAEVQQQWKQENGEDYGR